MNSLSILAGGFGHRHSGIEIGNNDIAGRKVGFTQHCVVGAEQGGVDLIGNVAPSGMRITTWWPKAVRPLVSSTSIRCAPPWHKVRMGNVNLIDDRLPSGEYSISSDAFCILFYSEG